MKVFTAALLTSALFAASGGARAQAPDQKATAQVLFERGRELVMQKNFADACPKFAQSLKLDPGLGTMLWLADCYENNGQTASAWAQFKEAASVAALQKDAREGIAKRRATALEPRLSNLVITLSPGAQVPGLEVRRDGIVVSPSELGVAVPVDPGVHALAATAPSRRAWSATVDVPASRTEQVVFNVPVLATDTFAVDPTLAPPDEGQHPGWSTLKYVGLGVAAAGVIGIGVGSVLGFSAKSANDESKADGHCLPDNECDTTGKDRRSSAQGLATGSTVAFVAGGVALAGGLALFFLAPGAKPAFVPTVSPTGASLSYSGAF